MLEMFFGGNYLNETIMLEMILGENYLNETIMVAMVYWWKLFK